jgi:TorA maturation chaperone TorD
MSVRGVPGAIQTANGPEGPVYPARPQRRSVSDQAQHPTGPLLPLQGAMGSAHEMPGPGTSGTPLDEIDSVDIARAQEYGLLSVLLARAPDAALLSRLALIGSDSTPLGSAHRALAEAAGEAQPETIEREYFDLFVGIGRGELLPYGSYYRTGFLNERPLARLRDDLHALGIERADEQMEPEDHAALLCEIMAGLINGQFGVRSDAQQIMFEQHLAPWIGHFFADMEQAKAADFYRHVGTVGRLFVEIEREAFALPA